MAAPHWQAQFGKSGATPTSRREVTFELGVLTTLCVFDPHHVWAVLLAF